MYNTFEEIKELGERLTGSIEIIESNYSAGLFVTGITLPPRILIGIKKAFKEFDFDDDLKQRGFSREYLLLQILLHEIAHYKQFLKCESDYLEMRIIYKSDPQKSEDVADRYALMYYRRFVKCENNLELKILEEKV